jgi:hypothetical protein
MFKRTFKDFKNLKKWEHILLCWKTFNSRNHKNNKYRNKFKNRRIIGVHENCGIDFCLKVKTKLNNVVWFAFSNPTFDVIDKLSEFEIEITEGIENIRFSDKHTLVYSDNRCYYLDILYVSNNTAISKRDEPEKSLEEPIQEMNSELIDW